MTTTDPARCPFTGQTSTASRTRREVDVSAVREEVEVVSAGRYHVRGALAAREVLRSEAVRQAGFMAEVAGGTPLLGRLPVLFEEGERHHEMRRSTARYFTPTQVATYQPMIARLADELVGRLNRRGEIDLDELSLSLAVNVAARVVGLTDSVLPGLERRVMAFVAGGGDSDPDRAAAGSQQGWLADRRQQAELAMFYVLDVKPAIAARRRERRDDLISHLLDRGYNDVEILTECLTYGTAGMVTTREFVNVAAWHLLSDPELRGQYVHGTERERHDVLHEILRLEPVVTTLYRRAERDLTVGGQTVPRGSVIAVDIGAANTDSETVGPDAHELCPGRSLPRGVAPQVLAFGDGHHRCPGAFLAIRESDVLLRRLLIWQDVEAASEPRVTFNEVVKGYEVRGLRIRVTGGRAALSGGVRRTGRGVSGPPT